jgi:hypothetical protein
MNVSIAQVVEAVLRRAQRQGFVVARDVRAELSLAGQPESEWKTVLEQAKPSLVLRQRRYYHKDSYSPRLEQERQQQEAIQKAIRAIIKEHRARSKRDERRGQARVDFIQPVKVRTEHGADFSLLSRDISPTGIRLLGAHRLLGQKVEVQLPQGEGRPPCRLLARILWTCSVGDFLFENGGNFLQLLTDADPSFPAAPPKPADETSDTQAETPPPT